MKSWQTIILTLTLVSAVNSAFGQAAATATVDPAATNALTSGEIVPLITIDEAPLPDAIRTLARQAGINFQFDPRVLHSAVGPDGKPAQQPVVSLRWENVTALQALTALLENHSLQLVPDPRTKIARITVRDPAALEPLVTRVIQLQYSNPSNLVTVIAPAIGQRSRVTVDPRTSQMVILATEREMEGIQNLVKSLDSATRQILIEARFIETRQNPRSIRGINWRDTLEGQRVTMGNNYTVGVPAAGGIPVPPGGIPTAAPVGVEPGAAPGRGLLLSPGVIAATKGSFFSPAVGLINADGINAVISLLNQEDSFNQIATPRAVALENVATELSVVRNVPVFEQEQPAAVGGAVPPATVRANYNIAVRDTILNEVGIKLNVTPRIFGVTNVFLDLKPEISEQEVLPATQLLNGSRSEAPIFRRQKISTQAMVPSRNTLVLGGLKHDRQNDIRSKVPFLGDIPGLGAAFRHKEKSLEKTDLLIFITPTILGQTDFQNSESAGQFLRTPVPADEEVKWSTIDSVTPYDWTKPIDEPRQ